LTVDEASRWSGYDLSLWRSTASTTVNGQRFHSIFATFTTTSPTSFD
jgi:hypothetical protein